MFTLNFSSEIELHVPNSESFQEQLRAVEPPALYLIRRKSLSQPSDWEEYRMPMGQTVHFPRSGRVLAFYSCHRDAESRAANWEFARTIHFDHFPPQAEEER